MIKYLYGRISAHQWLSFPPNSRFHNAGGVMLRRARGHYVSEPDNLDPTLLAAVQKINVEVAFTMSTETTSVIFSTLQPHQTDIILPNGSQLQVVDSLMDIVASSSSTIKKFQYAALVREEKFLLVWHDQLDKILSHAADIEGKLLAMVSISKVPWSSSSANRWNRCGERQHRRSRCWGRRTLPTKIP
jgi:hypothetical protein